MFFATHEKSARMFITQNVSMSSKTETRATRFGNTNGLFQISPPK